MQKKLVMIFVAIVLAFVFLVGRITYINASNGAKYTKIVLNQQQYDSRTIPFKRGDIVDRNGTKLFAIIKCLLSNACDRRWQDNSL